MTITQAHPAVESVEYMTTAEVALERRVAGETLRYWRCIGKGPGSFKIGRRVFYRRSDVEKWFAAQEAATARGGAA